VLLFFGQVRRYKGVPRLLSVFAQLDDPGVNLLVVGRPADRSLEMQLKELSRQDARVRLVPRFVSPQEVSWYFGAADLVVLPYQEILNSATALLALSLNRPIYVPRLGALGELAATVGSDWVRTFEGELHVTGLSDALRWALSGQREGVAPLAEYDWPTIARRTRDAYWAICEVR